MPSSRLNRSAALSKKTLTSSNVSGLFEAIEMVMRPRLSSVRRTRRRGTRGSIYTIIHPGLAAILADSNVAEEPCSGLPSRPLPASVQHRAFSESDSWPSSVWFHAGRGFRRGQGLLCGVRGAPIHWAGGWEQEGSSTGEVRGIVGRTKGPDVQEGHLDSRT